MAIMADEIVEHIRAEAAHLNIDLSSVDWNSIKLPPNEDFGIKSDDDDDDFNEEDSLEVPDEWTPPEIKPYTPEENLQQWLINEKGKDQFVIRAGSETEIMWNDARQLKADSVDKRPFWTESFVQWSPLGTYLATVHQQGAAVWGGATTFNRLRCYAHPQVKLIEFSPGEKYLVTYSSSHDEKHRVNIFDVRTEKVMRDFEGSGNDFADGGDFWPVFRWGGGIEDKYFARMGKNVLYVYETKTFRLINKNPIKVANIEDFSWSPTDPILAAYVPEVSGGNQPARVSLFQIPSKQVMRQKILYNVNDCKMYWQSNGEYLAVKVERYTKTKKSTYTGFEIFRIKEGDIPIDAFELDNKNDKVISFAWEPKGQRFAVIHGGGQFYPRGFDVSFYTVKGGKVSKLKTLYQKQADALFWSPGGRFIVLGGLRKGFNRQLEFYDVDDLKTMATAEHFMSTDIQWDPSGRYVATSVTSVHHEMESGFTIWSFYGKLLYCVLKDHFFQFLWRPRWQFLSPEKEEEIARNMKEYSKKYDIEDDEISVLLREQDHEKRKELKEEWERWVKEWNRMHEQEKMERQMLIRDDAEATDVEEEEEYDEVEQLLDVSEELLDVFP
ncbi:unnamed protein product [Lactuca saligna]|uniref:Eukaryotic translation initiation factor 3 subunit B n=1 Tax=Lactuca saligna TaxID=75948 RepID=A0AA35ZU09_LACSI|nr:unnamed protein product [Lactuca saligna]